VTQESIAEAALHLALHALRQNTPKLVPLLVLGVRSVQGGTIVLLQKLALLARRENFLQATAAKIVRLAHILWWGHQSALCVFQVNSAILEAPKQQFA